MAGDDLDLLLALRIGEDACEVRVCEAFVAVEITVVIAQGFIVRQGLTLTSELADAIGPALVMAAARCRAKRDGVKEKKAR